MKFWEQNEYPQLAANEYFCLKVAEKCGLDVPRFSLAEDASALVIDRFDLRPDGTYRGFEDFCVLNARRTDEKYQRQLRDLDHEEVRAICKLPAYRCRP